MSIENLIHRKAADYVAALQNPDAPELELRKPGRPPRDGEAATGHVHIRTTPPQRVLGCGPPNRCRSHAGQRYILIGPQNMNRLSNDDRPADHCWWILSHQAGCDCRCQDDQGKL